VIGTNAQRIRDLYLSFLNEARVESLGLAPFQDDIDRIRSISTHEDVARAMADASLSISGLFSIYVGIDADDPVSHTVIATQSGLGLPDRTYYTAASERLQLVREAYIDHIRTVLTLFGEQDADIRAVDLYALERSIASHHWSRSERRDATRTYNPYKVEELDVWFPGFPWSVYLEEKGLGDADQLVVKEATAFPPIADIFKETPVAVWRDYLLLHYVSANARYMPRRVAEVDFHFFNRTLRGQLLLRTRQERAVAFVNSRLEHAVGRRYVELYFPEDSRRQMREMFDNIKIAYRDRISSSEWMTPRTRSAALEKLDAMTAQIGYPDRWREYAGLDIDPQDLFGNVKRSRRHRHNYNIAKLARAVDKNEWSRGPQTVNAFYSPTRNEAFIPAGYIQSPLFDPYADPALNYGAIGSVIGHEIGHGFDDQGSRYGPDGRLDEWWTTADRVAFDALGDAFVEQFNQYEPLPGLRMNGRQTLGENIGDLAGVTVAYHAYLISLDGAEAPVLDGFTGPQRVFLGRAQARRYKRTNEALRRRVLTGVHSPMYLRVNGIIRNMDEWYEAFDIQPEDPLYLAPEDRVRIW
ncbi:MAG: M13 family metallopeptidase, partial [Pseudomonadota bacterium]